jgi:hypothetical protein
MMLQRGIRASLQFSGTGETKGLSLVFLCARAHRLPIGYKGPPPKSTCPFVMHFIRKSCLNEKGRNGIELETTYTQSGKPQKKKHVTLSEAQIDEFDNEEFVFRAPVKYLKGTEDDS